MIYGLLHTIREDAHAIVYYAQSRDIPDVEEDQDQRVQAAALRIMAFIGMIFGSLWTLSLLTFVVTIPLTVLLKLTMAVGVYVLTHDVFIMSQNVYKEDLLHPFRSQLMGLLRAQELLEEDLAKQFTYGTLLQPLWMCFYTNRNQVV